MATGSPDVTWRFNKRIDQMVSAQLAGYGLDGNGVDGVLVAVKAYLDATYGAPFYCPGETGCYPNNLIKQAVTIVMNRGK